MCATNHLIEVLQPDQAQQVYTLEQICFSHRQWSLNLWTDELADKSGFGQQGVVLGLRAESVGRDANLGWVAVASFMQVDEVADLNRIMVNPILRRSGLAKQLLQAGFCWAKESGAQRMMLEVECDNIPAVKLYEACGFGQISCRKNYYGTNQDALIMERTLR